MRAGWRVYAAVLLVGGMCWQMRGEGKTATASAPAQVGQIAGVISGGTGKLVRVLAVDREWADVLKVSEKKPKSGGKLFVYEGKLDDKGAFAVEGLLPGRKYDLIAWTQDEKGVTTRWEGADMDFHRDILPDKEATDDDKKWLQDFVKEMPAFMDKCRILHMAADHKHATLLVELARTREFHSAAGGEVIYRVELWYFENLFGGWAKDKNTEKVLARVRGKPGSFEMNWQFLPQLGGIVADAGGKGDKLEFKLPEKPDVKNGLAGSLP